MLTVTCKHNKLVIVRQLVHCHVGVRSDNLLLGRQIGALLELKVTNRTRESQVAVDATKVDKATGGANSGLFACPGISTGSGLWLDRTRRSVPSFWGL
jgi:hypothetical protein